ncbi:hypothetical protein [Sphingomonas sp. PAMC 26605]|uniref:hypothetical protein n=1 Tax=Sphingomonas sp. PAMC 26605 TaxID=1112214 RepID=UPI00026CB0DC|nr:hypothetical protein [Sphingomonas sp. PAMC 26605]
MTGLVLQAIGVLVALVFCSVRVVIDVRAARFGWGVAGMIVCGLLVCAALAPIPTHAVKIDLPIRS